MKGGTMRKRGKVGDARANEWRLDLASGDRVGVSQYPRFRGVSRPTEHLALHYSNSFISEVE
jgi:hypothetical protein